MKNNRFQQLGVLILSFAAMFLACKNEHPPKSGETLQAVEGEAALAGQWANSQWWQTLQATKSPLQAAAFAEISSARIYRDSGQWVAFVTYKWHEGMQYLVLPNNDKFGLINPYDKQKVHEIALQPDGSLRLDSFAFVRLDAGEGEDPSQVAAAVVLGGFYMVEGTGEKVQFMEDGTVTGLEDYKKYSILTDYVTEESGSDQLMLDRGNDQPDFFAFKTNGTQLTIYYIEQDETVKAAAAYKLGKPKAILTKSGQ